jgi:hypothetical protein
MSIMAVRLRLSVFEDEHVLAGVTPILIRDPPISIGTSPILIGDPPTAIGMPQILIRDPPILIGITPIGISASEILIGDPLIIIGALLIMIGVPPIPIGASLILIGVLPILIGVPPISIGALPILIGVPCPEIGAAVLVTGSRAILSSTRRIGTLPSPFPLPAMQNKILADNDSAREHAMSQPAVAALAPLPFELVLDDGEPLETEWHTLEYPLLRKLIRVAMAEQGRTDFYTGGNMFVYYSVQQA